MLQVRQIILWKEGGVGIDDGWCVIMDRGGWDHVGRSGFRILDNIMIAEMGTW